MTLEELVDKISGACCGCKQCDPSCTGNILKKCIDNNRFDFSVTDFIATAE